MKIKFTVALEIGQHFSGYGYSSKHDKTPRIPVDSSGKAKKIPSAVWYSKTKEKIKIGYDALDEYINCDGNPPEDIYYSGDLVIDYNQGNRRMQQYSRFLLGLLNAVLQFISKEHKNPNKADTNFVIIIKRSGETSRESSESIKRYVITGMTEFKENPGEIKHIDIELPEKLRTGLRPKAESVPPAKGIMISENKLTIGSEVIQGFIEDLCKNTRTVLHATCEEDGLKEVRVFFEQKLSRL
ncbi:uncharacterized protein LOC134268914 [Saccostrea cucullata]|uniref:uncharacterized protein LOC134268914 n=1 Tax=Saccostrea cuccullata TaxID=36930 RepID=UPI002ED2A28C